LLELKWYQYRRERTDEIEDRENNNLVGYKIDQKREEVTKIWNFNCLNIEFDISQHGTIMKGKVEEKEEDKEELEGENEREIESVSDDDDDDGEEEEDERLWETREMKYPQRKANDEQEKEEEEEEDTAIQNVQFRDILAFDQPVVIPDGIFEGTNRNNNNCNYGNSNKNSNNIIVSGSNNNNESKLKFLLDAKFDYDAVDLIQVNEIEQNGESEKVGMQELTFLPSSSNNNDGGERYKQAVGREGEQFLYEYMKRQYTDKYVQWVNEKEETNLPFDIKSFFFPFAIYSYRVFILIINFSHALLFSVLLFFFRIYDLAEGCCVSFIEVKTTADERLTYSFDISLLELKCAVQEQGKYSIFRLVLPPPQKEDGRVKLWKIRDPVKYLSDKDSGFQLKIYYVNVH